MIPWCPLSGPCLRRGLTKAGFSLLAALQFLKFINSPYNPCAVWKLELVLQDCRLCLGYSKDWIWAHKAQLPKDTWRDIYFCACMYIHLPMWDTILIVFNLNFLLNQWGKPQPCALVYFLCWWEVLAGLTALETEDLRLSIAELPHRQ